MLHTLLFIYLILHYLKIKRIIIMKLYRKTLIGAVALSFLLVGCGSSSSSTSTEEMPQSNARFVKMTMADQNIMQDTKTGLEWVEGNNKAGVSSGCNPVGAGNSEPEIKTIAEEFCSDLNFASHDDWRVATPAEHQEFITEMKKAGKTPFYANPACPRLVGKDANGDIKSVNTHNTAPVGAMTTWNDLPLTGNNAGIKCVRAFTMMQP